MSAKTVSDGYMNLESAAMRPAGLSFAAMLSCLRQLLYAVPMFASLALHGAQIRYNGGEGGNFAGDGIWTGGRAPQDGDFAFVQSWNTPEVSFYITSDYSVELKRIAFGMGADNGQMTFDTMGCVFSPKTSASGTYSDPDGVFGIFGPNGYGCIGVSSPADPNRSPYAFRDARFDIFKMADGSCLVDFNRGEFDFGLDSGEVMSFGMYEPSAEFRFSGTSRLKISGINTAFAGGLVGGGASADMTYKLLFCGGEHSVGRFVYGNGNSQWTGNHLLSVSNATLSVDKFEMAPWGKATFLTGKGAVLNIGQYGMGLTNANYYGSNRAAENHVFAKESVWNLNGSAGETVIRMGTGNSYSRVFFGADGATFNHNSGRFLIFGSNECRLTNTLWNATSVDAWWSVQYGGIVEAVGGSMKIREMRLPENGTATLVLDGGAHEFGKLKFGNNTPTDTAIVEVKGGASVKIAEGIGMETYSRAVVTVSGEGTLLETPQWRIGYKVGAQFEDLGENNCVTIGNGARVRVDGVMNVSAQGKYRGILRLNSGGTLEAKQVVSYAGINAGGKSEIEADGGTLRALANQDSDGTGILYLVDEIAIGAGGLTIDTAGYDARFNKVRRIADKSGSEGVLTKKGKGALKFCMANSLGGYVTEYAVAQTKVEEGELALTDKSTELATALSITGGATLSMSGAASSLTLNGLAVDGGAIAMDAGDRITVDGPASFRKIKVHLNGVPATGGELELLSVAGTLDAESADAWANAVLADMVEEGSHAEFSAQYDEASGRTVLKMAVAANAPMTAETVWQGTDGDWSNPANWSAGLPGYGVVAKFGANGASKTVTISSGARAGAMDFECGGYRLEGEAVSVKGTTEPGRIKVTEGSVEFGVPVEVNSAFAVDAAAEGASLVLEKELFFGEAWPLEKSGPGTVVLHGSNTISGNVFLEGGLTDVHSLTNAFGEGRTDSKIYLSNQAKLHFRGGRVDVPLEIVGGNNEQQFVFAEGETEIAEMRNPSGQLNFRVEPGAVGKCRDWRALSTSYKFGGGTFVLDGTVWQQVYATMAGTTSVAAVRLCRPTIGGGSLDETDGVQTCFRVDGHLRVDCDTLSHDWNSIMFYSANGVFDLNGHDVKFGGITLALGTSFGRLTSETPARFTHCWNGGQSDLNRFDIGGNVTFVFDGKGKNLNIGAPMTSKGGLVVTNGTVTMTADASWLNPTNATVFVGGPNDGRLVLTKSGTFSKLMNFDLRENGVLQLNEGVWQRCRDLFLDGSDMPAARGTWGATGSGAENINDAHFSGTGVLKVVGDGRYGLKIVIR